MWTVFSIIKYMYLKTVFLQISNRTDLGRLLYMNVISYIRNASGLKQWHPVDNGSMWLKHTTFLCFCPSVSNLYWALNVAREYLITVQGLVTKQCITLKAIYYYAMYCVFVSI